jgi:hypothetical protein
VDVVTGGLAANCTDERYIELLEQMAPIAEQVAYTLDKTRSHTSDGSNHTPIAKTTRLWINHKS